MLALIHTVDIPYWGLRVLGDELTDRVVRRAESQEGRGDNEHSDLRSEALISFVGDGRKPHMESSCRTHC